MERIRKRDRFRNMGRKVFGTGLGAAQTAGENLNSEAQPRDNPIIGISNEEQILQGSAAVEEGNPDRDSAPDASVNDANALIRFFSVDST